MQRNEKEFAMKIAVVGPGSLGCVFAALLAHSDNDVVLVGRPERVRQLREQGVRIHGLQELHLTVPATSDPASVGPVDLLLLCTKARGTRDLLATLRSIPAAAVASLQNGILKDTLLAEAFGPERVIGAATMVGAERQSDGSVEFTARGTTYVGEFDGRLSDRVGGLIAALDDAGLPAQAPPNIDSVIWSKACLAVGAFAVSVLTRRPAAEIMGDSALAGAMADLIAETATIAQAAGHELHDYPGMRVYSWARDPRHVVLEGMAQRAAEMTAADRVVRVSMLQDLLAGRPLEVNEVYGPLLEEAEARGVSVPKLAFAYSLLGGFEAGDASPGPQGD